MPTMLSSGCGHTFEGGSWTDTSSAGNMPWANTSPTSFVSTARLVVELDGDTHANDKRRTLDAIRTGRIERSGYRVVRFWNDEVLRNEDEVIQKIMNELSKVPSPHRGEG
jgi:Protein of unknown function (DUF559)